MSNETLAFDESKATKWAFAIAALIVAVLAAAYVLTGLAGVGLTMVIATPVVFVILIALTLGR